MMFSRRDMILFVLSYRIFLPRFGLAPLGGTVDQTAMLQQAIDTAAKAGEPVYLPPGIYSTRRLELRSGTHLAGMSGKSILRCRDGGGLIGVERAADIRLDGLVLDGGGRVMGIDGALFAGTMVEGLQLSNCRFLRSGSGAILVSHSENVIVAGNLVDNAATGIAVTNIAQLGKPALIKDNLVRNLFFRKIAPSHGNGILVEADAMVTGNVVEDASGFGILVGRHVRDVSIAENDIRNAHIGIGIPTVIAETAPIAGNRIAGVKDGAIRAINGPTPVGPDLAYAMATG